MKNTKNKEKLLTIAETSEKLGIAAHTVKAWIEAGRLTSVEKKVTVVKHMVKASSLKGAWNVECVLCGKTFKARHPLKAMFCTINHREEWFKLKRRKYASRGRPPKGSKPKLDSKAREVQKRAAAIEKKKG